MRIVLEQRLRILKMTKDELIARLGKFEWNDIECKQAQKSVPRDAYKTVSAFSNTSGGYLVFGVKDSEGKLDIIGVTEVDKVQNDFLSSLRGSQKLNRIINVREHTVEHEGKTLLVFHIPEAERKEKPIYLKSDIRESFIRRGAGDERCTSVEIERFLRDASDTTYDRELLKDIKAEEFIDVQSLAWYRRLFQEKERGRDAGLSDLEFLYEWGFIGESEGSLFATRAAMLLFGKGRYIRRILPRGVVDYQRIDVPSENWSPEIRWHDRVVVEENIIQAWQVLVEKYMRVAETPFSIDSTTLRRHDNPPDYISFREAAINLLIHQDYSDHRRKPVIKIFPDRALFWNPGDAFDTVDRLLEPTEKEVRNPDIVSAFRRIGLSDQAGTGMRAIIRNWRQIGYVPPVIRNDKSEKSFELVLLKEPLLTESQVLFQTRLGVDLTENEGAVFAFACRSNPITITDAKTILGRGNQEARTVLDQLVKKGLLCTVKDGVLWDVAEHLKEQLHRADQSGSAKESLVTDQPGSSEENLVTDQPSSAETDLVTPVLTKLNEYQRKIIELCEIPRKQSDLMDEAGLTHRTFFRRNHLEPLIRAKLVRMTHPDKPNHPDQTYVVTQAGLKLLELWKVDANNKETS